MPWFKKEFSAMAQVCDELNNYEKGFQFDTILCLTYVKNETILAHVTRIELEILKILIGH